MKNCPSCSFLMSDDEEVCSTCAESTRRVGDGGVPGPSIGAVAVGGVAVGGVAGGGGTAVLDRPLVVPIPESVKFRNPNAGRRSAGVTVMLAVVAVALVALVGMGVRHQGPLAGPLERIGVIDAPVVVVPDAWATRRAADSSFTVSLPAGAVEVDEQLNPLNPDAGTVTGYRVPLGEQGEMFVLSSDLGLGADTIRSFDTERGFSWLTDLFVANSGLGVESVRREVPVSSGRAFDSVMVRDDVVTTRLRVALVGDRVVVMATSGSDEGSAALDEAHPKLVSSFDPRS